VVIAAIGGLVLAPLVLVWKKTKDKTTSLHHPTTTLPVLGNTLDLIVHGVKEDLHEKALAQRPGHVADSNDAASAQDVKGEDIVSLFVDRLETDKQLDPKYLRDIVVNFLIAGRDTTAQALSWFFLELTQNPRVETALRQEIAEKLPREVDDISATMQDMSRLAYLEAALKETLQLHSSVPVEPHALRRNLRSCWLSY
jgi:hypothetical protein